MPRAKGLTFRMGNRGVARRLELLAAQIRSGRRECYAFTVEETRRLVMFDDVGEEVVIDAGGNQEFRLEVTPLLGPRDLRTRRRRGGRRS